MTDFANLVARGVVANERKKQLCIDRTGEFISFCTAQPLRIDKKKNNYIIEACKTNAIADTLNIYAVNGLAKAILGGPIAAC